MKRFLGDHCQQKDNTRQLALERGRGRAPGTPPPPLPPAQATLLLFQPPPLPGTPPSKLHVAALPGPALGSWWPQTPGLQPRQRHRRREEPTHFGALSSPLSTSISPAAAAGSPGSTPESLPASLQAHVSRPPSSAPPAETGRSGRRINFLVHSLCGLGKTLGRVELRAAQPWKPQKPRETRPCSGPDVS